MPSVICPLLFRFYFYFFWRNKKLDEFNFQISISPLACQVNFLRNGFQNIIPRKQGSTYHQGSARPRR